LQKIFGAILHVKMGSCEICMEMCQKWMKMQVLQTCISFALMQVIVHHESKDMKSEQVE
jgi:hypothetical protein